MKTSSFRAVYFEILKFRYNKLNKSHQLHFSSIFLTASILSTPAAIPNPMISLILFMNMCGMAGNVGMLRPSDNPTNSETPYSNIDFIYSSSTDKTLASKMLPLS